MIASGVLVLVALVTLVVGWGPGPDALLFVSMVASVAAGALLVLSFVKERKQRKATTQPAAEESFPAAPAEIEADLRSLDRSPEEEEPAEAPDAVPVMPEPAMAESRVASQGVDGEASAWDQAWAGMITTPAPDDDTQEAQEEREPAGVAGKPAPKPRAQKRSTAKAKPAARVAKPKASAKVTKPKPAASAAGPAPKTASPKPAAKKPSATKPKAAGRPKSSAKARPAAKPKTVSSRSPRSKPKP